MSKLWFTSDWHLSDQSIINWRTEFLSIENHDETIIHNFNECVSKDDTVIFCGDIALSKEKLELVKWINVDKKILVLGNHDLDNGITMLDLLDTYDEVVSSYRLPEGYEVTHMPIACSTLRGNIHGHLHTWIMKDTNPLKMHFNVSVDINDYLPIEFSTIERWSKEKSFKLKAIKP